MKDYALFVLAADGRIVAWHSGAERIYGYKREEIIGQHAACVYAGDEANLRLKLHGELKRTAAEGRLGIEGWHQRKGRIAILGQCAYDGAQRRKRELRGFAQRGARFYRAVTETDEALRQSGGGSSDARAESTVVGIVSGEFDRITEVSDAFLRMVGYSREELIGGRPDLARSHSPGVFACWMTWPMKKT